MWCDDAIDFVLLVRAAGGAAAVDAGAGAACSFCACCDFWETDWVLLQWVDGSLDDCGSEAIAFASSIY